ncbi:two-component system histidine kinase PnpS [Carnobacterium divergens]|uniref:two-component system histidine kinase PnpS n=1 Tax=Carnobacterium divergens TaxID=2748 RepID=UPI000D481F87|nr:ATP-binding protein [Carnobacterium divergens]MCO6018551.1 cell wall metabolism sensor histidine kinase WalK [Carnobacterium divergens]SPC38881.1 Sensory box protein [Carnobacterium divergens]
MMKKLQFRILAIFILLFSLLSLCIGIFSSSLLKEYALETQSSQLVENAKTIRSLIDQTKLDTRNFGEIKQQLNHIEKHDNERITLISLDGTVQYESDKTNKVIENHLKRPEIQEVLKGKSEAISERSSTTSKTTLYYVAVPLTNTSGQLVGVLRLSKPIAEMTQLNKQIKLSLFIFIIGVMILGIILTLVTTKRIVKPIEEVMSVATDLSENRYHNRYNGKGYGEIAELGSVINHLANSLEDQMFEIAQNDERINSLINHLVIGVMLLDDERKVQLMNPAMEGILGEKLTDLLGKSYVEATKSYGLSQIIEQGYRQKKPQNNEIYFYYPEEHIVDANIVPITGKNKGELNMIVLLYDITEIRKLEKVKSDFVTNASHELRTPVTALKGFSETLLDGAMEDKTVLKQFLEIMYTESSRLDLLVNDILELSKLEQKQVPLKIEQINVQEAILSSFRLVKKEAEQKKMSLILTDTEITYLNGDISRLKQILTNLISNAIAYTGIGGEIEVTVTKTLTEAIIEVTDNGMGIPEDELDRIFERFYRVDKARSRNSGGTGLGLSIVKYLVENFNGTIEVTSKLGLGTTFTVRLPFQD